MVDGRTVAAFGDVLVPVGDPLRLEEQARVARIRVDVIGVGGGVHDRLRALGYPVEAFNSGAEPTDAKAAERFVNRRAQAYRHLRNQMEAGKPALPQAWAADLARELPAPSGLRFTVSAEGWAP